jgi:hypothetical protein
MLHARRLRWTTWFAALALLLAAFAPAVSSALALTRPATVEAALGQICSASAEDAGTPGTPKRLHTLAHCPFCSLHAQAAPPPAAPGLLPWVPPAHALQPVAFLRAPRALWIWGSAQPRAPPVKA